MEDLLAGHIPSDDDPWYETEEQLLEPLLACYWSLWEVSYKGEIDTKLMSSAGQARLREFRVGLETCEDFTFDVLCHVHTDWQGLIHCQACCTLP